MTDSYYLLTFNTITDVLSAEALLAGYGGTMVPIPPEVGEGCGFAVRLPVNETAYDKLHVPFTGLYLVSGRGKNRTVERLNVHNLF